MLAGVDNTVAAQLEVRGWAIIDFPPTSSLLELADGVGVPRVARPGGAQIDRLRPRSKSEAEPNSLSSLHGLGAFPLHTDGAHCRVPPRFIMLRLAGIAASSTPTLVLDLHYAVTDLRQEMKTAVWLVNAGRRRFYTTTFSSLKGHNVFRLDQGCMRPASPTAQRLAPRLRHRLRAAAADRIEWPAGQVLVLDNWRVAHGRGTVAESDASCRVLERVLIDPDSDLP